MASNPDGLLYNEFLELENVPLESFTLEWDWEKLMTTILDMDVYMYMYNYGMGMEEEENPFEVVLTLTGRITIISTLLKSTTCNLM